MKRKDPGTVPRVVILGAGFAGIYAAINLSKELKEVEAEIVLIDCNNYHLFKPMLHEVATGGVEARSIIQPVRYIMRGRNFRFQEGMVQEIDVEKKEVVLCRDCLGCAAFKECAFQEFGLGPGEVPRSREKVISYDYLVVALGGAQNYFGIVGAQEHAFTLLDLDDAKTLREHVTRAFRVASMLEDTEKRKAVLTFVVVGAGPTGIEYVSALTDWVHGSLLEESPDLDPSEVSIYLVEAGEEILPISDEKTRARARRTLTAKVRILTSSPVIRVEKDHVEVEGTGRIDTYTTVWAAGVRGHPAVAEADLKKDRLGRVVVDEYLEADHEGIYALGDCSSYTPPGAEHPLPQTGQVAVQEAKCLVKNLAAEVRGEKRCAFRYRELGSSFSVGEYSALANLLGVLRIGGFLGWFIWKFTYLKHLWGIRRGLRGALEWFVDITYDREASRHKFSK